MDNFLAELDNSSSVLALDNVNRDETPPLSTFSGGETIPLTNQINSTSDDEILLLPPTTNPSEDSLLVPQNAPEALNLGRDGDEVSRTSSKLGRDSLTGEADDATVGKKEPATADNTERVEIETRNWWSDRETIDLMVVYTTEAREAEGGVDAINSKIKEAVADVNTVFENSLVQAELNLVRTAELNYTQLDKKNEDEKQLNSLKNPNDGYMDEVHQLRNLYGADIVSLFVSDLDGGDSAGIAEIMGEQPSYQFADSAFNVIVTKYAAGDRHSLAHELGHNLGLRHEDDSKQPSFPYGYGYITPSGERTIMANTTPEVGRLPAFSNPDLELTTTGEALGRENRENSALAINQVLKYATNWRQSKPQSDNATQGSITVLSPYGIESVNPGETLNITWNDNIAENVIIFLLKDGSLVETIAESTKSDGHYSWVVPRNLESGSDYAVQVSSVYDYSAYDNSNRDFSIEIAPKISIGNVTITEGDRGTKNAKFKVTLDQRDDEIVRVRFSTANGSAQTGSDYRSRQGILTFQPGQKTKTINIPIIGDRKVESNENFFVTLSNPTNAEIADGRGKGTIKNNDKKSSSKPSISITDVFIIEGDYGAKNAAFKVRLNKASNSRVKVNYQTVEDESIFGAFPGFDYKSKSGTITFKPRQKTKTIKIPVYGDYLYESDHYFWVELSNAKSAKIKDKWGLAVILDDD